MPGEDSLAPFSRVSQRKNKDRREENAKDGHAQHAAEDGIAFGASPLNAFGEHQRHHARMNE
jgi:hypothetical protein